MATTNDDCGVATMFVKRKVKCVCYAFVCNIFFYFFLYSRKSMPWHDLLIRHCRHTIRSVYLSCSLAVHVQCIFARSHSNCSLVDLRSMHLYTINMANSIIINMYYTTPFNSSSSYVYMQLTTHGKYIMEAQYIRAQHNH